MNMLKVPLLASVVLWLAIARQASAEVEQSVPAAASIKPIACLSVHGQLGAPEDQTAQLASATLASYAGGTADSAVMPTGNAVRITHESRLASLAHRRYKIVNSGFSSVLDSVTDSSTSNVASPAAPYEGSVSKYRRLDSSHARSNTSRSNFVVGSTLQGGSKLEGARFIAATIPNRVPSFLGHPFSLTSNPAASLTSASSAITSGAPLSAPTITAANQTLAAESSSTPSGSSPSSYPYPSPDTNSDLKTAPVAFTPQQAVIQDPDASGSAVAAPSKRIAQSSGSTTTPPSSDEPKRRAYPAPLDPVFCMTEYIGSAGTLPIGVPDTDPEYPMEREIYKILPALKKHRIKIYGWVNPGGGHSSSRNSNLPNSYAIVPNRIELDQGIVRMERIPDTVQTEHCDWGFRASMLYGIDYRFTTAQGWYPATKQLLQHNYLYGFDPVELYGMFYVPKVAQGLVLKFGRYISPPDIEAQLAPDNFMWTHSQMFTVDCYTQTGLLATVKLNDNWSVSGGIHAGDDIAPWDKAAIPSGELFVRWVSKTNNDSVYAGCDSINNGRFRGARAVLSQQQMIQSVNGLLAQSGTTLNPDGSVFQYPNLQAPAHDNLQQFNATWTHRFNKKGTIVTFNEAYFLYQYNALVGGTVNNGPPHTYAGLTGPGTYINGIAPAAGFVNYTAFKVTDKDYICIRPIDFLLDYKGERTGFATALSSWTLNWTHRFNSLMTIRPEIRYDRALNTHNGSTIKPYDNGNRRFQFTFGLDLIARF